MFGKPRLFPVQRSLLSASALLQEVAKRYDLPADTTCELQQQGLNDTYQLASAARSFVLRVYRAGWRSEEQILYELTLLEHLKGNGATVAAAIRTRSGNWFCIVDAPEGPRHVVLFESAPGRPVPWPNFRPETARAYGRGAGVLHKTMAGFHSGHTRFDLDLFHLIRDPLHHLRPRLAHRPEDLAYLEQLAERLRETVVALDGRGLTRGLCHGDLHGGNAHLDEHGRFTIFDFDCCGPGWRAYDLAVFRWALQRANLLNRSELWDAYLEGYRSQHELSALDETAVLPFVAARQFWLMGLHAANGPDLGFGQTDDNYFDQAMKLLRDWDAAWLY